MPLGDEFDPYHQWLGIPPAEQPPTLYRLLGLSLFEGNPDVIHAAADRQMAYLRSLSTGKRADLAQQLLNQVSAARLTLTGEQKPNYDAILRSAAPADAKDDDDSPAAPASPPQARPAKPPVRHAGGKFGPFDLLELVKQSPFGDTYKARHRETAYVVALKLLPAAAANSQEIVRRFQREQQLVTQLRHPNLIAGLAAGIESGQPWLAMEYVVGADLGTLVRNQGPLGVSQAVDYTVQAARGLMQLHMRDVYHRNIKPAVLVVDVQGQLKVTNLFLARIGEHAELASPGGELTMTGQTMGTAEYLPPEQAIDAKRVDQRADIYALGCTLHYLLTGRPPYPEKSLVKKLTAHQSAPIPSLRAVRADVSESLDEVFRKMLAKQPQGRFQSMAELIEVLSPQPKRKGWWQRLWGG